MALTRAQLLMGNSVDGTILTGQPQGVRPGGTGITIGTDGVISVNSQTIVGVMKLGQTPASAAGAYNGYTWPTTAGAAGQQLETDGSGGLTWADADGIDWTAKGQLIVGTGVATDALLNVGVNTSLLIADSTSATGLNYTDVSNTAMLAPSGTTAQRPLVPLAGQIRFNEDTLKFEIFTGLAWEQIASGNPVPGGNTFVKESIPSAPIGATGDAIIPAGTSAQRQTAPGLAGGHLRYNQDFSQLEVWNGTTWAQLPASGATDFVAQTRPPAGKTASAIIPRGTGAQAETVGATGGWLRFNTDVNELQFYNGTDWDLLAPSSGAVSSFVQNATPTARNVGDIWYNPTLGRESVWDGGAWVQPGVTQSSPTGYAQIPVGNTGQRGAPIPGAFRFNTDTLQLEYYNGGSWNPPGFGAGTRMLFAQASAPLGWVQETGAAYNDSALRTVTGAGGGSGGANPFTTTFSTYTPAGTVTGTTNNTTVTGSVTGNVDGTSLTVNEMPTHSHPPQFSVATTQYWTDFAGTGGYQLQQAGGSGLNLQYNNSSSQGGGAAHTHTLTAASLSTTPHNHTFTGTFTGTGSGQFNVKYIDLIVCTKT